MQLCGGIASLTLLVQLSSLKPMEEYRQKSTSDNGKV
jgi:hypothetical protein